MKLLKSPDPNQLTMAITELDAGGAEWAFVRIAIGLQTRGWRVNVVSLRDAGPLAEPLRAVGIPVEALGCGGGADVRAIGRMKAVLLRSRPSVLLTFLHQANLVGRLAGWQAGIKTVICGVRVADRRWAVRIPEILTMQHVTHYVAVSRSVAQVHQRLCGIAPSRIDVIYNGVDLEEITAAVPVPRSELPCSEDDQVILCVGRLSKQKAPLDVVRAFDELHRMDPAGHIHRKLLFFGDGPLKKSLQNLIDRKRLADSVRILGWREDVDGIMKSATVLVLASHWEGLPNVILEAQAAGLPVIASAVDGCRELIEEDKTGRLFPAGNVHGLANVLHRLLGSDSGSPVARQETLARLSVEARKSVVAHFSWEKCVAEYDELLRRLQSAKSGTAPTTER
ncbi:MAG TPA: glycosyltransferase [Planctomycetaceae bacterium]|nr:glycosyltransferase [Planctomycetaceae bacterium]